MVRTIASGSSIRSFKSGSAMVKETKTKVTGH